MKKEERVQVEESSGQIEGKNAVMEALKAGRAVDKIYTERGAQDKTIRYIIVKAREAGAVISEVDRRKLDNMSETGAHQGIIAVTAVREYVTVEEIMEIAETRGEAPLIVICDEITDPHNLGAVIRTAEAAGVHGVIIPKRRSAGITAIVEKTSAGAVGHVAVARVANIRSTIEAIKERGVWVYGLTAGSEDEIWDKDYSGGIAVVVGSEGGGMSRMVEESCDYLIRIPMKGRIGSLNASAAAAVALYEIVRQKREK